MITIETFAKTAGIRKRQQAVADFNNWFTDNIIKLAKNRPSLSYKEVAMHVGQNDKGIMEFFSMFCYTKYGKEISLYSILFTADADWSKTVKIEITNKQNKKTTVVTIPIAELDEEHNYDAVSNVLVDYFKN